ncbi:MAG: fibronectin type III domain-containing protein [Bdellovibrionaceae bacterium]|nr:fibronectin type III domain-containing protein [Pseudobdellovibrionaceae bacterium]
MFIGLAKALQLSLRSRLVKNVENSSHLRPYPRLLLVLIIPPTFIFFSRLSFAGSGHKTGHGPGIPQPQSILHLGQAPKAPTLVSPAPLSIVASKNVELQWTPEPEAFTYHVQVAKDPMFKWLIHENHEVKENRYSVTDLPRGTIFWRVFSQKPQNQAGLWKSSAAWSSFEVRAD